MLKWIYNIIKDFCESYNNTYRPNVQLSIKVKTIEKYYKTDIIKTETKLVNLDSGSIIITMKNGDKYTYKTYTSNVYYMNKQGKWIPNKDTANNEWCDDYWFDHWKSDPYYGYQNDIHNLLSNNRFVQINEMLYLQKEDIDRIDIIEHKSNEVHQYNVNTYKIKEYEEEIEEADEEENE